VSQGVSQGASQGAETQRARRARLANLRQELLAPVSAILGFGEMLHQDATRNGPEETVADLARILTAARDLHAMVDRLLDKELAESLFEGADEAAAQQKLRHDLRTPINAIKGYGEMLLEDLEDLGAERMRADFDILLDQADQLLAQIDTIVDFSRGATGAAEAAPRPAHPCGPAEAAAMFAGLVDSIRPVGETEAGKVETGNILVVDDMEANRTLLSRRLTRDGHRVTTAEGGRQALGLMEVDDFDLVLLDLMMPEMNGFEVLAKIKADPRLHRIPVIMISALDEVDSVVRCIEAGAEDYLPKPFNPILLKARINAGIEKKRWHERERLYLDRLEDEKEKFERLLLNILPQQIIGRLNDGETIIADRFDNVSVLFSDLVGFTEISSELAPTELVSYLNALFSVFDAHAQELGVEKIKMIGDAYMVVAGVPEQRPDHAQAIAEMALRMIETVERSKREGGAPFTARIGIHSGPVVAGIIGTHRFVYDVWGDTVNLASRLESSSEPNRIQVSEATAALLAEGFELEPRGKIAIKGKGRQNAYFLNAAKPATVKAR
jgi:class 3 adenylate cyclase